MTQWENREVVEVKCEVGKMKHEAVEVILFRPPSAETILFVGKSVQRNTFPDCEENIPKETSHSELIRIFGSFGLLYDINEFQLEGKVHNYAFVKYYTRSAAVAAQQAVHGLKVQDAPVTLKVSFSKPRKKDMKEVPLDINRSVELANYYLGFNGWSSSILSLSQESLEFEESSGAWKCNYLCRVMLNFQNKEKVEAVGKAAGGGMDRGKVIEYAKKNAITDARKNAFQSFAIITVGTRVGIHLFNEALDKWDL